MVCVCVWGGGGGQSRLFSNTAQNRSWCARFWQLYFNYRLIHSCKYVCLKVLGRVSKDCAAADCQASRCSENVWSGIGEANQCPTLLVLCMWHTAWCSEIGSLTSLHACSLGASSDVREPISLHHSVCQAGTLQFPRNDRLLL